MIKEYSNDDITVVWQPDTCIHSGVCTANLYHVFDPSRRPWIDVKQGTTEEINSTVKKCPSGALSFYYKNKKENSQPSVTSEELVKVIKNGPYVIEGKIKLIESNGREETMEGRFVLCRCGQSSSKPFCDGTHRKNGWKE